MPCEVMTTTSFRICGNRHFFARTKNYKGSICDLRYFEILFEQIRSVGIAYISILMTVVIVWNSLSFVSVYT